MKKSLIRFLRQHPTYIEKYRPVSSSDLSPGGERVVPSEQINIVPSKLEDIISENESYGQVSAFEQVQKTNDFQNTSTESSNLATIPSLRKNLMLDEENIPIYHDANTQCYEFEIDEACETDVEDMYQSSAEEIDARVLNLDKRRKPFVFEDDDRFVTKVCFSAVCCD